MIKSINQWSFPADMTAKACLLAAKRAGFEGFEPAFDEHGALSWTALRRAQRNCAPWRSRRA